MNCQSELFPEVEAAVGSLPERYQKLLFILELITVEKFLPRGLPSWLGGRPLMSRCAMARAFIAKMVFNIGTTRDLVDRLRSDVRLRTLCGYSRESEIPSESTFSRAFQEFSESALPSRVHEALIREVYEDQLVGHLSRDSTAINAREKPVPKEEKPTVEIKRKPGRPRKGEEVPKEPTRLERQQTMNVEAMLDDLPTDCNVGCKRNSNGHTNSWTGYKFHADVADGGVIISTVLTSASIHDSGVAIPLATMSADRVDSLYDLMDSAYDAQVIRDHSINLGHVPIIDVNPRSQAAEHRRETKAQSEANYLPAERVRYRERSTVERAFGRLKDEFGARNIRVKGHMKVMCHLMFGVIALTVDQLLRMSLM